MVCVCGGGGMPSLSCLIGHTGYAVPPSSLPSLSMLPT